MTNKLSSVALPKDLVKNDLIWLGDIGREIITRSIESKVGDSYFVLEQLEDDVLLAIIKSICHDSNLAKRIEFRIPENLNLKKDGLPDSIWFPGDAGSARNKPLPTDKDVMITAVGNRENPTDTLRHLEKINKSSFLYNSVKFWVEHFEKGDIAGASSKITLGENKKVLTAAIEGFLSDNPKTLTGAADYIIKVRNLFESGTEIKKAFGIAFPVLGLPRDETYFCDIKDETSPNQWKTLFNKAETERSGIVDGFYNGSLLLREDLENNLKSLKDKLVGHENIEKIFEAAAESPEKPEAMFPLLQLDWSTEFVSQFLTQKERAKKKSLADRTLSILEKKLPTSTIAQKEKFNEIQSYLQALPEKSEDISRDTNFFNNIYSDISEDTSLIKDWEKFIYPEKIVCTDFASGLLKAVEHLFTPDLNKNNNSKENRKISISLRAQQYRRFSEKVRPEMMRFFSIIYKDLRESLDRELVSWKTNFLRKPEKGDPLLDWDNWVKQNDIKENKTRNGDDAWSINFIISEDDAGSQKKISLEWKFSKECLASSLGFFLGINGKKKLDKNCVFQKPMQVIHTTPQAFSGSSGLFETISLGRQTSILNLTSHLDATNVEEIIQKFINEKEALINEDFKKAFISFRDSYTKAIRSIGDKGFNYSAALSLSNSYLRLLDIFKTLPDSEEVRKNLLGPILSVGTIQCRAGRAVFDIIPPWQPIRFYAIAKQHQQVANAINSILQNVAGINFGSSFSEGIHREADSPNQPPLLLGLDKDLLSGGAISLPTSHNHGFSLCTRERNSEENWSRSETYQVGDSVREVLDSLSYYETVETIDTEPNLLVIGADSEEFEERFWSDTKKLDSKFFLTLQNEKELVAAKIYNSIAAKSLFRTFNKQSFWARIKTRVFQGRLEQLLREHQVKDGVRPYHVALLDMAGSKQALFKWAKVDWNITITDSSVQFPVDRKKFEFSEKTLSQVFLIDPVLTPVDEIFLRSVYRASENISDKSCYSASDIYFPVKELRADASNSNTLGKVIKDSHLLADWVVTCDEMLTKQQLTQNEKLIIRCKKARNSDSSVIVSSSASINSLNKKLDERLEQLGINELKPSPDKIREGLFKEALTISGCVGLRAAKQIEPAGELIGLSLSKLIVEGLFTTQTKEAGEKFKFSAFLMLDDYASWFSQKENGGNEKRADILAFGVSKNKNGKTIVHIVITECKYCKDLNEVNKSLEQTKNTLSKVLNNLSPGEGGRKVSLSIQGWLYKFADMIMGADLSETSVNTTEFYDLLMDIRKGEALFTINALSHYFCFGQPAESGITSHKVGQHQIYQQIFNKADILELLKILALEGSGYEFVLSKGESFKSAYEFVPLITYKVGQILTNTEFTSSIKDLNSPMQGQLSLIDKSDASEILTKTEEKVRTQEVLPSCDKNEKVSNEESAIKALPYGKHLSRLIIEHAHPLRFSDERIKWADEAARTLRIALAENGLSVTELKHVPTPNGCLVVFKGSSELGEKVIENLTEKILMTRSLKIGFTEAAKGEFRIFIESEKREAVPMWNLWKERKLERNKDGTNTKLILGLKELDGTILYLDPLSMDNEPHTLIAGGTGSGKSVLMRMMLLDIAATNNPDQAKIYIVDPKMGVDYGSLRKLPHMASPIVSEPDQSFQIFDEVIAEMNRRYALFAEEGNENLLDYNVHHPESKLPVIWLIHDELPQVMSDKDYNTEMSPKMKTLATKARAAGIFMILLAQRPDKDVLPPQIRDNLGNRLALKLPTEASSKIALDKSGAEFLLGKGHLAAKIGSRITYAQCPFLNREETKEAVQAIIEDNRKE